MRPGRVRVARLFLLRGRYRNTQRPAGQRGAADDHDHFRRCHQQQQHRTVQGDIQRQAQEPQRVRHQSHVLRIAQVHQLLGGAGDAQERPRDCSALDNVRI